MMELTGGVPMLFDCVSVLFRCATVQILDRLHRRLKCLFSFARRGKFGL
jgi:hypothetical protein